MSVEVECFLTGDGKGMCAGHTKLKCRCWHCDLAFEDFEGDNLRPRDFVISIRWGAFLRSIPPTHRVGDMVHCCCRIVNAIFKRLCSDGRISQARALPPLLRSIVQSVMQATAHIPSEIRDAPQPTKDINFDLEGGRWFAPDETKHAKVVQLIQRHVGPQERVAIVGASIPLHGVIHRMLLSLWEMEKCWSNKIGLTTKELESYRWAAEHFAIDCCSGNPQCGCIGHVSILGGSRPSTTLYIFPPRNFHLFPRKFKNFSCIPTERWNVEFKMGIRQSFLGYKISRPYFSARAFTHVLELDDLDVGLQMWHALHDTKDKKRRIGRRKKGLRRRMK